MKFSHSLQFNAVPEWSSKYISYSQLKKLIYALQKEQLYDTKSVDNEAQPLLSGNDVYVSRFVAALDAELRKIDKFYISQETGLMANYEELQDDVRDFEQDLLNNRVDTLSDIVPGRRRSTGSARFSSTSSIDVPDDAMDDIGLVLILKIVWNLVFTNLGQGPQITLGARLPMPSSFPPSWREKLR